MLNIQNISRHELNSDQIALLKARFGEDVQVGSPAEIFFRDDEHFEAIVNKKVSAVVAPMHVLLDCLIKGGLSEGTVLIVWHADEKARKSGKFALAGASIYSSIGYDLTSDMTPACIPYAEIRGMRVEKVSWTPTVMTDFRTGESVPYPTE